MNTTFVSATNYTQTKTQDILYRKTNQEVTNDMILEWSINQYGTRNQNDVKYFEMIDGISKQFFLFTQESIEVSLYQEGSKCYAVTSLDDGSENDDAVTLWEAEAEEN